MIFNLKKFSKSKLHYIQDAKSTSSTTDLDQIWKYWLKLKHHNRIILNYLFSNKNCKFMQILSNAQQKYNYALKERIKIVIASKLFRDKK